MNDGEVCERGRGAMVMSVGDNVTTTCLCVCCSLDGNHILERGKERVKAICRGKVRHVR